MIFDMNLGVAHTYAKYIAALSELVISTLFSFDLVIVSCPKSQQSSTKSYQTNTDMAANSRLGIWPNQTVSKPNDSQSALQQPMNLATYSQPTISQPAKH